MTGASGGVTTVTCVESVFLHPKLLVAVTSYQPVSILEKLGKTGFSIVELKDRGPVQLKVSPAVKGLANKSSVSIGPAHKGELLERINVGFGYTVTCVLSVSIKVYHLPFAACPVSIDDNPLPSP